MSSRARGLKETVGEVHIDTGTQLKQVLIDTLQLELTPGQLTGNTLLLENGLGLDSVDVLNVVLALEATFHFKIGMNEVTREAFSDVAHLVQLVQKKQGVLESVPSDEGGRATADGTVPLV